MFVFVVFQLWLKILFLNKYLTKNKCGQNKYWMWKGDDWLVRNVFEGKLGIKKGDKRWLMI